MKADDFTMLKVIGRGAFGEVQLVRNKHTQQVRLRTFKNRKEIFFIPAFKFVFIFKINIKLKINYFLFVFKINIKLKINVLFVFKINNYLQNDSV